MILVSKQKCAQLTSHHIQIIKPAIFVASDSSLDLGNSLHVYNLETLLFKLSFARIIKTIYKINPKNGWGGAHSAPPSTFTLLMTKIAN